jgi:hypothetical protein
MSTAEQTISSAESMNDTRPILEQMGERAVEQSPAWGIPRLGMTQVMLAHQDDARRRAWDSHRVECKALGLPDPGEYQPMGDFSVQGDSTTINHHYPAPVAPVTPVTTPTTSTSLAKRIALPLLCGALGIGGPIAGIVLAKWFNKEDAPVTQPADIQDWRLGVQVSDRP